jgi:hypothetical protein
MKFFLFKKEVLFKTLGALLITIMVLSPFSHFRKIQEVEAAVTTATIVGGIGTIQETISAGANTAGLKIISAEWVKENILDGIAWSMINMVLHELSRSIVTWINSGFQGSPAFITDLQASLLKIADAVAGEYIWYSGLKDICSPFQLDIKMALDIQYRKSRDYKIQCRLSDAIKNVQNAASGLSINNWDQFFEVSMHAENNPYGSLVLAQNELTRRITGGQEEKETLLSWANGFMSDTRCEKVEGKEKCTIVTPGSTIENQLNETLASGQRRLEVADEINEIVAALFAQLAKQAITGAGGLLGLTQASAGGGGNYYDQLARDTTTVGLTGEDPFAEAIEIETEWLDLHEMEIALILEAENMRKNSCLASTTTSLPTTLENKLEAAMDEASYASSTLTRLSQFSVTYETATSGARATISREYMEMQARGLLHTDADIYTYRAIDLRETREAIDAYRTTISIQCSRFEGGGA